MVRIVSKLNLPYLNESWLVIITRSRAKQSSLAWLRLVGCLLTSNLAPHEYKNIPFPVKALQLIVRELQEMGAEVEPMSVKDVPDVADDDSDDAV
jgi:hypothetical protein